MSALVSPTYVATDGRLGSYLTASNKPELLHLLLLMHLPNSRIGVNQFGHHIAGLHNPTERQKAIALGVEPAINWQKYNHEVGF